MKKWAFRAGSSRPQPWRLLGMDVKFYCDAHFTIWPSWLRVCSDKVAQKFSRTYCLHRTKLGDVLRNRDTHRLYLEFVPTCWLRLIFHWIHCPIYWQHTTYVYLCESLLESLRLASHIHRDGVLRIFLPLFAIYFDDGKFCRQFGILLFTSSCVQTTVFL